MRKIAWILSAAVSLAALTAASAEVLPLPENLIALDSAAGEQLLFGGLADDAIINLQRHKAPSDSIVNAG